MFYHEAPAGCIDLTPYTALFSKYHGGVARDDGPPRHARARRRAQSSAAEADLDEVRAGIHNDRGFDNHFQDSAPETACVRVWVTATYMRKLRANLGL